MGKNLPLPVRYALYGPLSSISVGRFGLFDRVAARADIRRRRATKPPIRELRVIDCCAVWQSWERKFTSLDMLEHAGSYSNTKSYGRERDLPSFLVESL